MAIDIKFDLMGNPEPPTIILANRNGNKLGQLSVNADSIDLSDKFNDASELSFTLNKYVDDELTPLWDKVVDFKLVYCKEWDEWFEIKVELDEATETVKTVFCTQLGQAELSQIMLYNIEINTDVDIERDDYKISILYDPDHQDASILHRVLKDKAPHYTIAYVSPTIAKKVRNFSFDGTSIYDAFQEIAEEIGCLFLYYASINENGVLERKIAVHDLQQTCNNESCGYRGEFTDKCPKCGGTDITNGYGEDTLIFVTSDELASEGIQLTTDTDSVKNCFKLEGGDDLMTATIRNCNPNGTDYIWYFSDSMKEDMSEELVQKIESYDEKYKEFYNERVSNLETQLLSNYNALVDKYSEYNEDLQTISSPITGYPALMNAYYNTIDLALYLESGLMPSVEMSETNADEQVGLLTSSALSPVAVNVEDVDNVSLATANSAVLSMAKIIVKSTYKVEIKTSTLSENKVWSGQFVVTNYSDEEDTATSETISVTVNNDAENFIKQKIEKALNKENTEDLSISGLFNEEKYNYNEFCDELKKYALNPLKSFYDACEACLSILIDQGAGNQDEKPDLYESLYEPYFNKSVAIANEIQTRENEIAIIKGVWNKTDEKNPTLITKGLQQNIEECRNAIQAELNFETYLGETLWLEFCAYRREDKYSNDNYISDGLNNAEVFERALEFVEVAENEIYKSSELQHSISTTLNNLLAIPKFKSLVDSFKTGNWIRVQVDDKVYKLRLLKYDISFGDFNTIPVEFSDVTKIKNGTTDVQDVFAQASSMATSYSSVQRQANQGGRAKTTLEEWISDGLSSANVQIQSNDTEDITLTKHGLLARSYDDVAETYSPEQLKITHNIMAYTDDNWRTVRQAIGKHEYKYFDKKANDFVNEMGYGVTADFLDAGIVSGSQIVGGDVYSDNYSITNRTGSYLNLRDGTFSFGGGALRFEGGELLISSPNVVTKNEVTAINEEYLKTTSVYAQNLKVDAAEIQNQLTAKQINTEGLIAENISATTIEGKTIEGGSLLIGDKETDTYAEISPDGKLTCINANITGTITAISGTFDDGTFNNCTINEDCTIKGKLEGAEGTFSGTVSGATIEGGSLLIGNKDDGYGAWISDEDYIFHAYGAVIEGDSTFSGTITASDIVGGTVKGTTIEGGSLLIGDKDEDDETSYYAWISEDGVLNANGANITGIINATDGGTIGGWEITANGIEKKDSNDNSLVGMYSGELLEDTSKFMKATSLVDAENESAVRFYSGFYDGVTEKKEHTFVFQSTGEEWQDSIVIDNSVHIECLIEEARGLPYDKKYEGSEVGKSLTAYIQPVDGKYRLRGEGNILPTWLPQDAEISVIVSGFSATEYDIEYLGNGLIRVTDKNEWIGGSPPNGILLTLDCTYSYTETINVNVSISADQKTVTFSYTPIAPNANYSIPIEYTLVNTGYNFRVLKDGSLYSNAAQISGHIEADSGQISNLKIQNGGLVGYFLDENQNKSESFSLNDNGLRIFDESASVSVGNLTLKKTKINNKDYVLFSASDNVSLQAGKDDAPDAYIRFGGLDETNVQKIPVKIYAQAVGSVLSPKVEWYAEANSELPVTRTFDVYCNTTLYSTLYPTSAEKRVFTINAGQKRSKTYEFTSSAGVVNKWMRFSTDASKVQTAGCNAGYNELDGSSNVTEVCMGVNGNVTSAFISCEPVPYSKSLANFLINGNLLLDEGKKGNLGAVGRPWEIIYGDEIYWKTKCEQGSDSRLKNTIQDLSDAYGAFFDNLHPVSYKFNEFPDKIHTGFIAQEVEESMIKAGLQLDDFAGLGRPDLDKGKEYYGLSYTEFIALCVNEIQKLKKRVAELESK